MKNSSSIAETIEQNRTRSSSGCVGSAASSSTRSFSVSAESSRLRIRSAGRCLCARGALVADLAMWRVNGRREGKGAYRGAIPGRSPRSATNARGVPVSAHAPIKPRPVQGAQRGAEEVARSSGFEWLARAGFVSRGLIYGIIGILAIKLALGAGGKTTNQQGALKTIAHQPFGKVLLILVAIGLAGYALWRLVHALLGHGPEELGLDLRSSRRVRERGRLRRPLRDRGRDPARLGRQLGEHAQDDRGCLRLAGGTWLVGIAGAVLIGSRPLPGLPRHQPGLPQGLEDRGDEPEGAGRGSSGSARSGISRGWSSSASSASS